MSKIAPAAFFAGAVRTCIEESKFYEEELASAEPMNQQTVGLLDRKIKDTHEIYVSSIEMLSELERSEIEHEYKAIRKRLLKGMIARYKAIICPAQLIVAEAPMMDTEEPQSLALMAVSTESGSELGRSKLERDASGNVEEIPITRRSLLKCPENYQPITFSNESRTSRNVNPFSRERRDDVENRRKEFSWGGVYHPRAQQEERMSIQNTTRESDAVRNWNVKRPYVWAKQTPARGPVWGVPYPPMAHARPMTIELKRNDPEIIGMAEIWTQKVGNHDAKKCAPCQFQGNHRMYGCTALQREGIQLRWYYALKCGVCLNCLMIGHSSFTCKDQGCCKYHGTRHSTFLCEGSFKNQM